MVTIIIRHCRVRPYSTGLGVGPASVNPEAPRVAVAEISKTEHHELERSSERTIARPMLFKPIKLVEELADDADALTEAEFAHHFETADGGKIACGIVESGRRDSEPYGVSVEIAVLDTGIDADHPAFPSNQFTPQERDFGSASTGDDGHGHGTHRAGKISGRDANQPYVASFSNTHPDFSVPSADVISVRANSECLTMMSGTSMACPHAAGLPAHHWRLAASIGRPRLASSGRNQLEANAGYGRMVVGCSARDVGHGQETRPMKDTRNSITA